MIKFGDYEFPVLCTELTYDVGTSYIGYDIGAGDDRTVVTIKGLMDMDKCDETGYNEDVLALTKEVLALDLSEEDRLLRDHGVVDAEGLITRKGQLLLLNLLLLDNKEELVGYLKRLDEKERATAKK